MGTTCDLEPQVQVSSSHFIIYPTRFSHEQCEDIVHSICKGLGDDADTEQVGTNFITSYSKIYDACELFHDKDYDEDIPMKQVVFMLPPDMIGTNAAFNEGMCV